jgi:hypothetical protein
MRTWLAALVFAAFPAVAAAQTGLPSISAPLPPIGLPLPSITAPLPSISLPPPPTVAPPITTAPPVHTGRFRHPRFVFVVPYFDYWGYPVAGLTTVPPVTAAPAPAEPPKEEPRSGTLRLDVQPEKLLQVFVDGYFVGTPEDFQSELRLDAGTYTIELSAPGYQSEIFRVKIDGSRPITYRGTLKPIERR